MIISDEFRFVFVHVPKCAGTSIRRGLRPIDSSGGRFERIDDHPAMGQIHLAHITLPDLALHFPDEFAKVRDYRSLAVVRDPMARFSSALFQRLREFRGYGQSAITPEVVEAEAEAVMRHLATNPERLDAEFVHFNRQVDFIDYQGERVVGTVLPVERAAEIADFIAGATGVQVGGERRNRTTELSLGSLKPIQRLLRKPYSRLVSPERRARIREQMTRAGFYRDVPKQRFLRPGGPADDFVRNHYAPDFALYDQCR